jgi:hypothetical protein
MPWYEVSLERIYRVTVKAGDSEAAAHAVEYLDEQDTSSNKDRKEFGFEIRSVELVNHDAFSIEAIERPINLD